MANYNFDKDLKLGNKGEQVIMDDLKSLGATIIGQNNTSAYDFVILYKGKRITYECKTDFYNDTGNLFVETKCRGKDSGIIVTKADWFVTYFVKNNDIWYIKVDDLRELIESVPHKKTSESGDKNSHTEGYLIDKNKYKKNFIIRRVNINIKNPF
jgi:hypothetical protein